MENQQYHFGKFFWRITAAHMVTYMIMGMFAASLLDYQYIFDSSLMSCFYRPFNSPWIAAGPGLQIFRGLAFALALWYFKESFLHKKYGWLKLWGLLVGLAILSTAGAAPGSIEGFIYTKIPVADQIIGYLEVVPQTGFFALFVCYWYENPKRIWNIISIVLVLLIVLMSFLGALASIGIIAVC
jgi:hypothetical protein